ncbi:hypothetical protein LAZ67_7000921 [Cordylochernes scorpioides]|uniref:Uncharacterized protein n=1 Tax=Cordylochernes scorpioides TaxID=51811 RepID=A0ABY6KME8_9ARAC|nr:hypothetical protein LAZ67_7000921 [Cordylochernes scorpioides]
MLLGKLKKEERKTRNELAERDQENYLKNLEKLILKISGLYPAEYSELFANCIANFPYRSQAVPLKIGVYVVRRDMTPKIKDVLNLLIKTVITAQYSKRKGEVHSGGKRFKAKEKMSKW